MKNNWDDLAEIIQILITPNPIMDFYERTWLKYIAKPLMIHSKFAAMDKAIPGGDYTRFVKFRRYGETA